MTYTQFKSYYDDNSGVVKFPINGVFHHILLPKVTYIGGICNDSNVMTRKSNYWFDIILEGSPIHRIVLHDATESFGTMDQLMFVLHEHLVKLWKEKLEYWDQSRYFK